MVLKHLLQWVCSAHQFEVVEGDLARDALTLSDNLNVLLGGSRVLFDCLTNAISSFRLAFINEFVNQGRWGLFGHSSARAFPLFLARYYHALVADRSDYLACMHYSVVIAAAVRLSWYIGTIVTVVGRC